MATLKDRRLLFLAAKLYRNQQESFSHQEIIKQMNQVKYLSKQKKLDKFTLQKKIEHLEESMESLFTLEKKLAEQKKTESTKIAALKRQNTMLKKKLSASQDKDLHKKINKLNHLLGDNLAKKNVEKDISLKKLEHSGKKSSTVFPPYQLSYLQTLMHRVNALKQELAIMEEMEDIQPEKAKILQENIQTIEDKLRSYLNLAPSEEIPSTFEHKPAEVKHTLSFDPQPLQMKNAYDKLLEQDLPLPPPPRITVKE